MGNIAFESSFHDQAMGDVSIFHHIYEEMTSNALWRKLEAMYENNTFRNKAIAMRRLVNLKYRDRRSILAY